MSGPDQGKAPAGQNAAPMPARADEPQSSGADTASAVGQLRALVCGLGVGLLVLSLAFNAFVYKQNRNLLGAIHVRKQQTAQMQAAHQRMVLVVNELAKYSRGKPELTAVFNRHGIDISNP